MSRLRTLAVLVVVLAFSPSPSNAADTLIQPGARLRLPGEGWCTANFVFRDTDTTYIGTAGHCTSAGDVIADDAGTRIGETEFSVNAYPSLDFALVRIDTTRLADVSPEMRAWGGPTGVAPTGPGTTDRGRVVYHYGYGKTLETTEQTRTRAGVLTRAPTHTFSATFHGMTGDSGSPVILDTGEALGIMWGGSLGVEDTRFHPEGNTMTHIMTRLRLAGYDDLTLVTAPLR